MTTRIHRVPFDRRSGASLYVEELGDPAGPPVIFGHSLLCDGRMFADQVTALATRYRVLNIDYRGHGRSDVARRRFSLWDQADDLARVMDAVGVASAVHVGLSMGGMTALRLAVRSPERVRGLVLLDTSATREHTQKRIEYSVLGSITRAIGLRPFIVQRAAEALFGATFRAEAPDVVALWQERIALMAPRSIRHAVGAVSGRDGIDRKIRNITAPTLVIVGEEDTATPVGQAQAIAEAIAGSQLEVLPATGHLSTIERPAETTQLLRAFCDGLGRG